MNHARMVTIALFHPPVCAHTCNAAAAAGTAAAWSLELLFQIHRYPLGEFDVVVWI